MRKETTSSIMLKLLFKSGKNGMTTDELFNSIGDIQSKKTITSTLLDLQKIGKVVKTKRQRKSDKGHPSYVHVLTHHSTSADRIAVAVFDTPEVEALKTIVGHLFYAIKNSQMPSGDSKVTITPFDITVLNKLAAKAKIRGI